MSTGNPGEHQLFITVQRAEAAKFSGRFAKPAGLEALHCPGFVFGSISQADARPAPILRQIAAFKIADRQMVGRQIITQSPGTILQAQCAERMLYPAIHAYQSLPFHLPRQPQHGRGVASQGQMPQDRCAETW